MKKKNLSHPLSLRTLPRFSNDYHYRVVILLRRLNLNYLLHLSIAANYHSQLCSRPIRQKTIPQTLRVKFIRRIISVHKLDDLLLGHASVGIAPRQAEMLLLFLAPVIHILDVLGINVQKRTKHGGHLVVFLELLVDGQKMLETVLVEGSAGSSVFCCDGGGGDGTEADAPAFEDDDLKRRGVAVAVVDGFP